MKAKKGILLVNLGTPDSPGRKDVYKYLKQFLLDPRVIDIPTVQRNLLVRGVIAPFRSKPTGELYKRLWTPEGSPLKIYGERVEQLLQEEMGDEFIVKLAMRYQKPSIKSGIDYLLDHNVKEIIVFPMFPQYASASTGSVQEEVMSLLSKELTIPNVRFINSFYDHPSLIKIFADNAKAMGIENYDHIIFSFHGIPQRHLKNGDRTGTHCLQNNDCCQSINVKNQFCYSAQCHATAFALAKELGLEREKYTISFQSRLGKDPWTQPYTWEKLDELAEQGVKKLLVFSPSFVSDCLETTVEIGYEYKEDFAKAGGDVLDLVPSLNDDPRWVSAIKDIVLEA